MPRAKRLAVHESNSEIARRGYEAFNRGQVPFDLLDPGIEIRNPRESPQADVFRGYQGMQRYLDLVSEAFEEIHMEPEEFIERGERLLVMVRTTGRARGSGMSLDALWGQVWTVREGKAVRLDIFTDRQQALAALEA